MMQFWIPYAYELEVLFSNLNWDVAIQFFSCRRWLWDNEILETNIFRPVLLKTCCYMIFLHWEYTAFIWLQRNGKCGLCSIIFYFHVHLCVEKFDRILATSIGSVCGLRVLSREHSWLMENSGIMMQCYVYVMISRNLKLLLDMFLTSNLFPLVGIIITCISHLLPSGCL